MWRHCNRARGRERRPTLAPALAAHSVVIALTVGLILACAGPVLAFSSGGVSISSMNPVGSLTISVFAALPQSRILPQSTTWGLFGGQSLDPVAVVTDLQSHEASVLQGLLFDSDPGVLLDALAVARSVSYSNGTYVQGNMVNYVLISNGTIFRLDLLASNNPQAPGFKKFDLKRYTHLTSGLRLTSCIREYELLEPSDTCRKLSLFAATTAPLGLPAAAAGGVYVGVSGPVLGTVRTAGYRAGATLLHLLPDVANASLDTSAYAATPASLPELEFYSVAAKTVANATHVYAFARSYLGAWTENADFWTQFQSRPPQSVATADALYVLSATDLSVVRRHQLAFPGGRSSVAFGALSDVLAAVVECGVVSYGGGSHACFYVVTAFEAQLLLANSTSFTVAKQVSHRLGLVRSSEPASNEGRRVTSAALAGSHLFVSSNKGRLLKILVDPFPTLEPVTFIEPQWGLDYRAPLVMPSSGSVTPIGSRYIIYAVNANPSKLTSLATLCPEGYMVAAGALSGDATEGCTKVPNGFAYSFAKYPSNTPFSAEELAVCPAGSYTNERDGPRAKDACVQCPPGQYSTAVQPSPFQIDTFCPACTSTPAVYDGCQKCPAGTFANNATAACYVCPAGTFSDDGAVACTPCDAGTSNPKAGGRTSAACGSCGTGQRSNAGAVTCEDCPSGHVAADRSRSCSPCSVGTYAVARGNTTAERSCVKCPANRYAVAGATECLACPSGMVPNNDYGGCQKCPAGSFADPAAGLCALCPANSVAAVGSTACKECSTGHVPDETASACVACSPGTYRSPTGRCLACPAPMFSTGPVDNCTACGTNQVPNGERTACVACAAGYFRDDANGTFACRACPAGTHLPSGASACVACSPGTVAPQASVACTACPPGTYQYNATYCAACGLNAAAADYGSLACAACAEGYVANEARTACAGCPKGSYRSAGLAACTPCPAGSYADGVGSAACKACSSSEICLIASVSPISAQLLRDLVGTTSSDSTAATSRRALAALAAGEAAAPRRQLQATTAAVLTGGQITSTVTVPAIKTEEENNRRVYLIFAYIAIALVVFMAVVGALLYLFLNHWPASRRDRSARKRTITRLHLLYREPMDRRRRVSGAFFTFFGVGVGAVAAAFVWVQFALANYQIVTSLNPGASPSAGEVVGAWLAEAEFFGYTGPCSASNGTGSGGAPRAQDVYVSVKSMKVGASSLSASPGSIPGSSCRVRWTCTACRVTATTNVAVTLSLKGRLSYAAFLSFNLTVPHDVYATGNITTSTARAVFRGATAVSLPIFLIPVHFENKDDGAPHYSLSITAADNRNAERSEETFDLCPPDRAPESCASEAVSLAYAFEVQQVYLLVSRKTMLTVLSTLANLASLLAAAVGGVRYLVLAWVVSAKQLEKRAGIVLEDEEDDKALPAPAAFGGPAPDPDAKPAPRAKPAPPPPAPPALAAPPPAAAPPAAAARAPAAAARAPSVAEAPAAARPAKAKREAGRRPSAAAAEARDVEVLEPAARRTRRPPAARGGPDPPPVPSRYFESGLTAEEARPAAPAAATHLWSAVL